MRLAVIYNTCGIKKSGNAGNYIRSLHSIIGQLDCDKRVCVSSCKNTWEDRHVLLDEFKGSGMSMSVVDEVWPVNVTFNMACRAMEDHFGRFDGYCYIDSGIILPNPHCLSQLVSLHMGARAAMTAARVSTDSGTFLWFKKGNHESDESGQGELFASGPLIIPIGKTVNLHMQIFSDELFVAFNRRLMPDIFASFCTESVFSFMCSAIGRDFVVSDKVVVDHSHGMDEGSAGFNPRGLPFPAWQHLIPQANRSILDIINDPEAHLSGFGYEECQGVKLHNPECYSGNKCNDPKRLLDFMVKNLLIDEQHYRNMQVTFLK